MYVCICNAVRERSVRDAIARGCQTVRDVYRGCGVQPRCGKCGIDIAQLIERHTTPPSEGLWPVAAE